METERSVHLEGRAGGPSGRRRTEGATVDARRSTHLKHTRAIFQRSIDHDKVIELIDEATVLRGNTIAGRKQNVRVLGYEGGGDLPVDGSFSESLRRVVPILWGRKRREPAFPDRTCCIQSLPITPSHQSHRRMASRKRYRRRNRTALPFWTLADGADDMFSLLTNSS